MKFTMNFFQKGIDVVVCLAWAHEAEGRLGFDLIKEYQRDGFATICYGIDDFFAPDDVLSFSFVVDRVFNLLKKGCNIVVHCHAGIKRTGILLCCIAKRYLGVETNDLVTWLRSFLSGAVLTPEQEAFLHEFPLVHPSQNNTGN